MMQKEIPQAPTFKPAEIGPTCLVTGGAGYLGSALVRRLRTLGCTVHSLDVLEHQHDDPEVKCFTGDLRHYSTLKPAFVGVDTVFHTAALINLLSFYRPADQRLVYDVNCVGTENVLRAAADAGARAMVHTSTFNVVLDRVLNDKDETLPYARKPRDLYSQTKIVAEKMVLEADQAGGLRTAALRPGGIWGSDTRSLMIKSFLEQLADGKFKVRIGSSKATMDNTHVENLVDAHLLAACALHKGDEAVGGEAFFITDGEPVNGLQWFQPLVEALGERFPRFALPAGLMKIASRGMELAHFLGGPDPLLTYRGIRNLTESSSFRIDKARERLGYLPRYQRANGFPELLPAAREMVSTRRAPATA